MLLLCYFKSQRAKRSFGISKLLPNWWREKKKNALIKLTQAEVVNPTDLFGVIS